MIGYGVGVNTSPRAGSSAPVVKTITDVQVSNVTANGADLVLQSATAQSGDTINLRLILVSDGSTVDTATGTWPVTSVTFSQTVAAGTYRIEANVEGGAWEPSASFDVPSAGPSIVFADDFDTYTAGNTLVSENSDYFDIVSSGLLVGAGGGFVTPDGGFKGVAYDMNLTGTYQSSKATFQALGADNRAYLGVQDASNLYYVTMSGASGAIRKRVSGSDSDVVFNTSLTPLANGDVLELRRDGNDLMLVVNGTTRLTATDTTFMSGDAGFMGQADAEISRFEVQEGGA